MARKYLMTWVGSQRRWTKWRKGTTYSVSVKQLRTLFGCAEGKDGSWLAANAWWEAKEAELLAKEAAERRADPANQLLQTWAVGKTYADLSRRIREGEAAREQLALLQPVGGHYETESVPGPVTLDNGKEVPADEVVSQVVRLVDARIPDPIAHLRDGGTLPLETIDSRLNLVDGRRNTAQELPAEVRYERLSVMLGNEAAPVPTERTVAHWCERWLTRLRTQMEVKGTSAHNLERYTRHIAIFREWIGGLAPVEAINEARLEEWWGTLAKRMRDGQYSAAYCTSIFMASRQFLAYLAEVKVISPLANLRSKAHTFNLVPKEIETFEVEEVRALVQAAEGKSRLYLLLMLNCGMTQADLSEFGADEWDEAEGTVTRKRSKRAGAKDAQTVKYRLWPETAELLAEHAERKSTVPNKHGKARLLLTEKGKPLTHMSANGKRYDTVEDHFRRAKKAAGVEGTPKMFRKTGATLLGNHPEYGRFAEHYLAHAGKSVADRHYVKPSDPQFFAALDWLRGQLFGE